MNWEKSRTQPSIVSVPAIIRFLGYYPFLKPITLPQQLLATRRENGWTIKNAAEIVGVDPGTWGNWERGQAILYLKHRELMARFLGLSVEILNEEMAGNLQN